MGMSRKGITYEEVASAARDLIQEGKRVTAAAVRERLGRGSMTTIQRHLQAWRENEAPVEAVKKSMALQEMLERLAKELEPSKQMAEQAASLYRAFLGPETERALKKLAVEFERARQELERSMKSLAWLRENTAQKLAEGLRQNLELQQRAVEDLGLQSLAKQAQQGMELWKKMSDAPGVQQLAAQLQKDKERSKKMFEALSGQKLAAQLQQANLRGLTKGLSVMRPPEPAPGPRARGADLEELARRLQALERRLERLERGGQNGG